MNSKLLQFKYVEFSVCWPCYFGPIKRGKSKPFMFFCNLIKMKWKQFFERLFLDRWFRCTIICSKIVWVSPDLRGTYNNSLLNTVMNDSWFRASNEVTQSTQSTFSTVSNEDLRLAKPINAHFSHIWGGATASHCLDFPPCEILP